MTATLCEIIGWERDWDTPAPSFVWRLPDGSARSPMGRPDVDDLLTWLLHQPCCAWDDPYNVAIEVFVRPIENRPYRVKIENQDGDTLQTTGQTLLSALERAVKAVAND